MKYSIFIFFTLLCLSCDKPRPLGGASATYTYYGADQNKKAPVGFEYLPKVIRDSSMSYLTRWLGPKYLQNLNTLADVLLTEHF